MKTSNLDLKRGDGPLAGAFCDNDAAAQTQWA